MTYDVTVNRVASLYRTKLADKTNVKLQHEFLFNKAIFIMIASHQGYMSVPVA